MRNFYGKGGKMEKQRLIVGNLISESKEWPVESSRFQPKASFVVCMSSMVSSGVPMNFMHGSYSNRHENFPYVDCCDFSEVYVTSSSFSL